MQAQIDKEAVVRTVGMTGTIPVSENDPTSVERILWDNYTPPFEMDDPAECTGLGGAPRVLRIFDTLGKAVSLQHITAILNGLAARKRD